jgi:hypothetical protein
MNTPSPKRRPLVLLELNEINFAVVKEYVDADPSMFPALQRLMAGNMVLTTAESKYEEIEPWIQWVSVHTGLSYEQHKIFRLGDITGSGVPQLFEQLEGRGIAVGCISPMNAENRLKNPSYFVPDPWTGTKTDGSWWSRTLHGAISQAVNDNAKAKVSVKSLIALALGVARFAKIIHYPTYLKLLAGARQGPWRKALFLDLFLHDLHMSLLQARKPGFSSLFLNAGAHIQHHYFLSAKPIKQKTDKRNPSWYVGDNMDPVKEMLTFYDGIVSDYLQAEGIEVIVATGLSQQPYDRLKYYYRLQEHQKFLQLIGVKCLAVQPRMTRDFLVDFVDHEAMKTGLEILRSVRVEQDGLPLFDEIEERGTSAFVTLTYPHEITGGTTVLLGQERFPLLPHVAFVALKNGMHRSEGYAFFTAGVAQYAPGDHEHVKALNGAIMSYFGADLAAQQAANGV